MVEYLGWENTLFHFFPSPKISERPRASSGKLQMELWYITRKFGDWGFFTICLLGILLELWIEPLSTTNHLWGPRLQPSSPWAQRSGWDSPWTPKRPTFSQFYIVMETLLQSFRWGSGIQGWFASSWFPSNGWAEHSLNLQTVLDQEVFGIPLKTEK